MDHRFPEGGFEFVRRTQEQNAKSFAQQIADELLSRWTEEYPGEFKTIVDELIAHEVIIPGMSLDEAVRAADASM